MSGRDYSNCNFHDDLIITFLMKGDETAACRVASTYGIMNRRTILKWAVVKNSIVLVKHILSGGDFNELVPESWEISTEKNRRVSPLLMAVLNFNIEVLKCMNTFKFPVDPLTRKEIRESFGAEVDTIGDIINILTIAGVHNE